MDCKQAEDLQLAVKYVLGELPPVQRDEYEDHYIDCPQCAKEVYAAAALTDTAREVFRQKERGEAPAPVRDVARDGARGGWLAGWLRPAFAVPVMLALLAVVGYQSLITLPRLKSASTAQILDVFSLVGADTRGERGGDEVKVQVQQNEVFLLKFDFLPKPHFDHYLCQVQDEAGRVVQPTVAIPVEKEKQEVYLRVSNGVERPGKYSVVIVGDPGAKGVWNPTKEVARLNFAVDFHR